MSWSANRRFDGIDILRGLAALMVVSQHAAQHAGLVTDSNPLPLNFGRMGIVTFFAISGFVIPMSLERHGDPYKFFMGRVFRIYPLLLCCLAIVVLCKHFPLHTIVAQVFLVGPLLKLPDVVGNSWTLTIEAIWYIAICLAFVFKVSRSIIAQSAVICTAMSIAVFEEMRGHNLPLGWIGFFVSCVLGLLAYRYHEGDRQQTSIKCMVAIYLAAMLGVFVERLKLPRAGEPGELGQIATWTIAYALFIAALAWKKAERAPAAFKFLGKISYSIYLVHTFAFMLLDNFGVRGVGYFALVFLFTIPAAALTQRFIEVPGVRLGKLIVSIPRRQPKVT